MKMQGNIMMFLLFCLFMSCSMEESLPVSGNTLKEEQEAIVSVSITTGVQSKSVEVGGEDSTTEITIGNNVVFLLNKESDSYHVEDVIVNTANKAITFFTKNADNKYLYAVTNVSDVTIDKLKKCATLPAIQAVPLAAEDLRLYPKASDTPEKIDFNSFTDKGDGVLRPEKALLLEVAQRTARIELKELTYSFAEGTVAPKNVTLKSITLVNQHIAGLVNGEDKSATTASWTDKPWGGMVPVISGSQAFDVEGVLFNTYANTSKETKLVFVFNVEGQIKTTEMSAVCVIKTPIANADPEAKVYAGNIHRLKLNAVISSHEVKISFTATVLDWKRNEVIDLGDINVII